MSPPWGKSQLCISHMSWDAEENCYHCWLFDTTRLPQNLLESLFGISWNLMKPLNSGWVCTSLSLLRKHLSRVSLQWTDSSHFSKILVEICDLQDTRWCFGLQGWAANVIYLMLSLERGTLVQSNPWILTCNGKFGGSIPSNHSGQREAESCYSSLPLHKVYSSVKPIDIPKAQCIHWGKLDLSPGGVTAFPRAHLTPRSCTRNCRGLITLNYRTVLCHCLPRLEWISAEEQSC